MKPKALLLFVTLPLLGDLVACSTLRGPAQLEVRHDPFEFVDELSGQQLDEVLLVPRYSSFSGISTGGGHGPGAGHGTVYVASPSVYRSGESFRPLQPNSHGVIAGEGAAYTGKGVSLNGVLVVCPGYEPLWLWDLWDQGSNRRLGLTPLKQAEAVKQLQLIADLLHSSVITGDLRALWSLGGDKPIEVRLTAEQLALVDRFVNTGLSRLRGRDNSHDAG
jgi:hypothetical protein